MSPSRLMDWEPVLKSQVAVSLLLLAALLVMTGWCIVLYRENQHLAREWRKYLLAQSDFGGMIDKAREAVAFARDSNGTRSGDGADHGASADLVAAATNGAGAERDEPGDHAAAHQ